MSDRESSESDEFASAESEAEEETSGSNLKVSESSRGTDEYKREVSSSVSKTKEQDSFSHPDGASDSLEGEVGLEGEDKAVESPEEQTATEKIQHSPELTATASEEKFTDLSMVDKLEASEVKQSALPTSKPATTEKLPIADETSTGSTITTGEANETAKEGGGGGGWGSWGGWGTSLWSSVSTVAESAQALGQKVTSVIATVEDSLGVPSPDEHAESGERNLEQDEETRRLADTIVEHDVVEEEVVNEEPQQVQFDPEDSEYIEEGLKDESRVAPEDSAAEGPVAAMSSFFSGVAAVVQTTGQGLVSGGLDALETLGKKTLEVLSEGDPGLAKKRAMLGVGASPSLSQLLLEAKAEASARAAQREGGMEESSTGPLNYSRLFEEYNGVGHLEALELLSKECVAKSRAMATELSEASLQRLQEKVEELAGAFIIEEDQSNLEDDTCKLLEVKELLSTTSLPIKSDKLLKVSSSWREKVDTDLHKDKEKGEVSEEDDKSSSTEINESAEKKETSEEQSSKTDDEETPVVEEVTASESNKKETCAILYGNGLRSLAELTSASIELFRKMAEVSLVPQAVSGDALALSKTYSRLTVVLLNELDALASVHAEAITNLDVDGTNSSVTSLYLESSNSGSYVQDAFQLLQPVLRVVLTQQVKVQQPVPDVINRN